METVAEINKYSSEELEGVVYHGTARSSLELISIRTKKLVHHGWRAPRIEASDTTTVYVLSVTLIIDQHAEAILHD